MESIILSPFIQPSVEEYLSLLHNPIRYTRGGNLNDIIYYSPETRGAGIFSFLKRTILPLIKQPVLKFGSRVLSDVSEGKDIKTSFKSNAGQTFKEIGNKVIRGGKKIKKRKQGMKTRKTSPRKRYKSDIFDNLTP